MTFLDFLNHKNLTFSKIVYVDQVKHSKKFDNAYDKFQVLEDIIAIIDNSMLKSGKSGVVFTNEAIYVRDDFSSPVRYDLSEIETLDCELTLTNNTKIIINGKSVIKIIPSSDGKQAFRDIEQVVQGYIKYINFLIEELSKDMNDNSSNTVEMSDAIENEKKVIEQYDDEKVEMDKIKKELENRERLEREKAELEKRTVSTEDGSSKVTRESVLKTYESDAMYDHIYRTRETLTSALFNYWGRASSDRDKLAIAVKNYFSHNLIYIRENSIDKYDIYQLKNDLATFEISLFISKFLCGELQARGLNREQILFVLVEGLNMLFSSVNNIEMYMQIYVTIIDEYLARFGTQKIPIDDMFYMNILYANITGNSLGMPMIDGLIEYYEVNSELCKNNARELAVIMRSNIDKFNFKYRWEVRERCAIEFNYIARTILGVNIIDNHRIRVMKENIDDIVKILRTMRVDLR